MPILSKLNQRLYIDSYCGYVWFQCRPSKYRPANPILVASSELGEVHIEIQEIVTATYDAERAITGLAADLVRRLQRLRGPEIEDSEGGWANRDMGYRLVLVA